MFDLVVDSVPLAIVASIPLLLAVEGELIVQRGGIINLGIEGMMLTAAMTAAFAAQTTHNLAIGFVGGVAGAAMIAALFGLFAIVLRADQIVTGTAINLLALGGTSFVYHETQAFQQPVPQLRTDPLLPLAWIVAPIILGVILWNSSFGLRLRACGEHPEALLATGRSVRMHRWAALMIEGLLVGLPGAAIFGLAAAMQYALQAANRGIPFHLLLAVPYVVTLLILCGVAGRVRAPEALGRRG